MIVGKKRAAVIAAAAAAALVLVSSNRALAASSPQTVSNTGTVENGSIAGEYWNGMVDGSTQAGAEIGTQPIEVEARVSSNSEIVYNIKIEWGAMKFDYSYGGSWNPTTHTYTTSQTSGWDPSQVTGTNAPGAPVNNGIRVTNNSNFPVTAEFSYDPDGLSLNPTDPDANGSVIGMFADDNTTLVPLLSEGKGNVAPTPNQNKSLVTLEILNNASLVTGESFYFDTLGNLNLNYCDKYFALSGRPEPGGPTSYTKVGTITVTLKPVVDAKKYTVP